MGQPKTIMIDNQKYVRESDIQSLDMGEKRIVVADRGWIFVGDCIDKENSKVEIRNAKNIRRWGTTKGLGELSNGPTSKTQYDDYGTVTLTPVISINVIGGWDD